PIGTLLEVPVGSRASSRSVRHEEPIGTLLEVPVGAIFCGRKATLIEIRQLSLTAACKARHGVGRQKSLIASGKRPPLPPKHRAIREPRGGGRGNPVAL